MLEPIQILLFFVIIILTILVVIISWQIFQILFEIRKMLIKFNTMANSAVSLTASIEKSFQSLSGFSQGIKTALNFFSLFSRRKEKDNVGEK